MVSGMEMKDLGIPFGKGSALAKSSWECLEESDGGWTG